MSDENIYYIVCDAAGKIPTINKIVVFNREVSMLAIFRDEDDAINTAFEITERTGVQHQAQNMAGTIGAQFA